MECLHPKYISKQDMVVPCGNCAFCAVTRRSDWSLRLHYEAKQYVGSRFVTLTYANNHLTWDRGNMQLVKADLQNWFKRLRKAGHKCRYYAVGEYGSKTMRPHYHVILFGDVPDDALRRAWARYSKKRKKYYEIGHVHIGKVSGASIMYCLGYLVNSRSWKMRKNRVRPFCLMSRRPGIGANYLSKEMKEWHKSGRKNYAMLDGEKRHLPRYYKVKIFSKIDLVRIAVRDQNNMFREAVKRLRSPRWRNVRDPVKIWKEQARRAAQRIKAHSKENLTI